VPFIGVFVNSPQRPRAFAPQTLVREVLGIFQRFDHDVDDGPRHPTHPRRCPDPHECPNRGAHAGGQGTPRPQGGCRRAPRFQRRPHRTARGEQRARNHPENSSRLLMTVQQSSVRSLQIAFHNARGLRSSRNELEVFADDHDLDALLVSETKLQPGTPDPNIRGFELYRSDRTRGPGGGTAIYVRRGIRHHQIALPVLQNLEATAVTIATANGPLTIISCYHPPRLLLRENDINEILRRVQTTRTEHVM
jgi:hypothetical protein